MTRTLRSFIVMGILSAIWISAGSSALVLASAIKVTVALPQASIDLSDLDARDRYNRPIKSVPAKRQLERLFVQSLNDMLTNSLTPGNRVVANHMNSTVELFKNWFGRPFKKFLKTLSAWLMGKKQIRPAKIIQINSQPPPLSTDFHELKNRYSFDFLVSHILSSTCLQR